MSSRVTAFLEGRQVASGERGAVAALVGEQFPDRHGAILVIEDGSGRVTDLDYWQGLPGASPRSPGRPKLGVQAREVTLLPRHWDWLSARPGGASAALRRLVDEAIRKGRSDRDRKDAAYRFMQAACGDMAGYEEALRSLYRSNDDEFRSTVADWPADIRRYIEKLLSADLADEGGGR